MVINHLSGMILQVGFHFFISGFCYNRNVQLVDRWHEWEPCRYGVGAWGEKQVGCCTRESWLWLVLDTLQCLLWFWWWWRWWWSWWLHISAIYILYTIIVFVVIVSGVSLWCKTGETFGSSTYTDPGLTPISDSVPRANWVATDEGGALQSRKKKPVPLLPGCLMLFGELTHAGLGLSFASVN